MTTPHQVDLFADGVVTHTAPPPRARRADPQTSHAAAARAAEFAGDHETRIFAAIKAAGARGATAKEIAAVTGLTDVQVSRRLKAMGETGRIERRAKTDCSGFEARNGVRDLVGDITMLTQCQRVRAFTDALPDGEWTKLGAISAHIGEPSTTTSAVVSKMVRNRQLVRRGRHPNREYRSGPVPVTAPGSGGHNSSERVSKGFMELARLSKTDPKEFARLTRADRGFKRA